MFPDGVVQKFDGVEAKEQGSLFYLNPDGEITYWQEFNKGIFAEPLIDLKTHKQR